MQNKWLSLHTTGTNGVPSTGIVQTRGTEGTTATTNPYAAPSTQAGTSYSRPGWTQSSTTNAAQQAYTDYQNQRPGAYQSQYGTQLQQLQNQIANRPGFSYDINGDALYQQASQRYQQLGRQAMMDTMGQAAAGNGGYGSSYAQSAGQQAYNSYLQAANDNLSDYYNMALSRYQQEGSDLYNQYSMYQTAENQDYSRWQDQMNAYNTELNRLYGIYNDERTFDYGQYSDSQSIAQQEFQWYIDNGMTPPADIVAAAGYSQQYVDDITALWQRNAGAAEIGGGGGGGGSGGGGDDDTVRAAFAAMYSGGASQMEIDQWLNAAVSSGALTQSQATQYRESGAGTRPAASGTGGNTTTSAQNRQALMQAIAARQRNNRNN